MFSLDFGFTDLRSLHTFKNLIQLGIGDAQCQNRLLLGTFSTSQFLGVLVLRKSEPASGHQDHGSHGARQCRTQPEWPQAWKEPLAFGQRRSLGLTLMDSCHHPLGEGISRVFRPQCLAKIIFRKMHIVPLLTCVPVCCATLPASDGACSLPC